MRMPIEVVWYNGQRGSWCQAIVEYLTVGFTHRMDTVEDRLRGEGAIVVVKADQIKNIQELNRYVSGLKWLLLIVTANEDGTWQWDEFKHPNSTVWLQTPHKFQHATRFLPWGWTPGCSIEVVSKKLWDFTFAGQVTHRRRKDCVNALRLIDPKAPIIETDGFAKGLSQHAYYTMLGVSRVIPCPSGPVTVDSMRVCEALQLGAIPVLDGASPSGPYPEYWTRVFGQHCPLPIVGEWSEIPAVLEKLLAGWPEVSKEVSEWWQIRKESWRLALSHDLHELGAL